MSEHEEFLKVYYASLDPKTAKAAKRERKKEYKQVKHLGKEPKLDENMPSVAKGASDKEVVAYVIKKHKIKPENEMGNN